MENQNGSNIIFFDIDGTLMDEGEYIPCSAAEAIQAAKKRGHYCFICTGRALAMIPEPVKALGFDGIICGGGTYVSVGDKVIEKRELTKEELQRSHDCLSRGKLSFLYEGNEKLHVMPWEYYEDPEDFKKQLTFFNTAYETITDIEKVRTSKFSCHIPEDKWQYCNAMAKELDDSFLMIVHSKPMKEDGSHALTEGFVEFLPKGYDKSVGIEKVVVELGLPIENTYAFGDGSNDLGMLRLVAHSVAMGNASKDAMEAADYVTSDLREDGILRGMKHYGLI